MDYPAFFDTLPAIRMYEPLAKLLGASQDGMFSYTYTDVVKLAGHSCPTTAGAFLMLQKGLNALYPDTLPVRGNIRVELKNRPEEHATGVIGSVASLITGASDEKGFRGLGGKFARAHLLFFGQDIPKIIRLSDVETGESLDIDYQPESVLPEPVMKVLMQKVQSGSADQEEKKMFGALWQKRVEKILQTEGIVTLSRGGDILPPL